MKATKKTVKSSPKRLSISSPVFSEKKKAVDETGLNENTFPEECPWSLKEILLMIPR